MIYSEIAKSHITAARYHQHRELAAAGLVKAFGQLTGIDTEAEPGILIIRKKPARAITDAELEQYPLLAHEARVVYSPQFNDYGSVLGLQYLIPNNKDATLSVSPFCYAALHMKLVLIGVSNDLVPAAENFSAEQAAIVFDLAEKLSGMASHSRLFELSPELVLYEPVVTPEDIWLI